MLSGAMRRFPAKALALSLLLLLNAGRAGAAGARTNVGSEIVTTRHTITVEGVPLAYTARAGLIPLTDEATGEVHAKVFFVSYTADRTRGGAVRPLTFYTEGGPGGPGTLDDLGPRSLKGARAKVQLPPPPYEMVDNPNTWLTFSDLVLIDPVGTGYSRATKPEYATQYYNREGDAESIAQFIKLYLQRYEQPVRQPIFVAGVSYGAVRSALIADIANRRGIPLRGLILVSSPLAKQPDQVVRRPRRGEMPSHPSDLTYIQLLPTFTASAFFHKKLCANLQRNFDEALGQAERWATRDYPKVLTQADGSNRKRLRAAAAEMSRLTGLESRQSREFHLPLRRWCVAEQTRPGTGSIVPSTSVRMPSKLSAASRNSGHCTWHWNSRATPVESGKNRFKSSPTCSRTAAPLPGQSTPARTIARDCAR